MTRTKVKSSMLNSLSHDSDTGILEIEFSNGKVAQYEGVSHREYMEMLSAPSIGKHFNNYIKGQKKAVK